MVCAGMGVMRVFALDPVFQFYLLSQKPKLLNLNLIWNLRATGLSGAWLLIVTFVKQM